MNIKVEIVTLAIRALQSNTTLLRRPDTFENFISAIFTGQTIEERQAHQVVATAETLVDSAKKMNLNRKFKKIVQNF